MRICRLLVPLFLIHLLSAATISAADLRHVEDAALHDVQFIDGKEGWAVGDEGVVWHTISGGKKWYRQPTGTRASLRSVCFLSARVGWIAGREELPGGKSAGVLLYTQDGGLKWHRVLANRLPGLNKVTFVDANSGFLLGDGTDDLPSGIFKTTNRGAKWSIVTGPRTPAWLDGDFADAETGALAGAWSRMSVMRRGSVIAADVDPLGGRNIRCIRLMDGGRAVAVGAGGLILISATQGTGWGYAELGLSQQVLANLDFAGVDTFENHVWVVGRPGSAVMHSKDRGRSWEMQKTNQSLPLSAVHFRNANDGWAVGALGTILHTEDGGKTWSAQRQGGKRVALMFANAHGKDIPLETIAKTGLEEGFLIAGLQITAADPRTANLDRAREEQRFAAAVRLAGGAAAEMIWQFPLPDHFVNSNQEKLLTLWNELHNQKAADQMLRQLVLSLRLWRPDVVVVDSGKSNQFGNVASALALEAMKHACKLAADKTAFAEQIDALGLQPWRVSKFYALEADRAKAAVSLDGNELCQRLEGTPRDHAATAAAVLMKSAVDMPPQRFFRLLQSHLPDAGKHPFLMTGLAVKTENEGARRLLPAEKKPSDRLIKAMKARRNLQILTEQPIKGLTNPQKLSAEISRILDVLPPEQGAAAAFAIASRYARRGQWPLAQEAYLALVDHYPTHPLTAQAYRWLVQHNSSSEVRRRYELKQFAQVGESELVPPKFRVPEKTKTPKSKSKKQRNDDSLFGPKRIAPGVQKDSEPLYKPSSISGSAQFSYLANQVDLRKWNLNCLEFAKRLAGFGPLFARDPAIQFCLQSSRRQLGQFKEAEDWCKKYKNNTNVQNPWRQAAAAELWLLYRDGQTPKPHLMCGLTPTRPFLDGQFDDACWQDARAVTLDRPLRDLPKSERGRNENRVRETKALFKKYQTQAQITRDEAFLYVAVRCTHPPEDYVAPVKKRPRDADLRSFDRVSLMIDLDRDYSTYFHFQVDQRGCVREDCWGDSAWNPRWFVAVRSTKTSWQVEAAIPLSELSGQPIRNNTAWACNLVRILPGRGTQYLSGPAEVEPRPEGMGLLLFQDGQAQRPIRPVSGTKR